MDDKVENKIRAKSCLKVQSPSVDCDWEFSRDASLANVLANVICHTHWTDHELDTLKRALGDHDGTC